MAWNEPGGNKEQDPWGGKNKQQKPPELDELFKNLKAQFNKLLGGKPNKGNVVSSGNHYTGVGFILLLVIAIWAGLGVFIVNPAERAVVLQLGKYKETLEPGIHWIPRLIQKSYIVNEQKIDNYAYQSQMLTKDENIVSVAVAVQFRIQNAKNFLFNVVNPDQSLRQATASALRQVVGQTTLDNILTKGRDQARQEVEVSLNKILTQYQTGILITAVTMQPARAPDAVKDAFDDAIKAQEDEQRFVNQAQAYTMQVEPIAKGHAQRIAQEANAYKEQIVLRAKGDTARFLALLPEYQKAPEVTKQRLYLDIMERLMRNTSKVLIDTKSNNNVFYLPLDKVMQNAFERSAKQEGTSANQDDLMNSVSAPIDTATSEQLNHYGYSRDSYFRRTQNENN
ncbi:MAG: hflK [Gammaproteobacteria bacterium]|jgi:membrane protease subunit HflK|nr:hflK [Gammaproteobacteria bacterium]